MSKRFHLRYLPALIAIPFALGNYLAYAETEERASSGQTVEIAFTSVTPETGKIWVGVCTEDQLKKRYQGDSAECASETWLDAKENASVTFDNLSSGIYAITAFHDEDGSGALDFDTRGIPFEATGNGNNAKGNYGPPTFNQMKFTLGPRSETATKVSYTVDFYRAGPPF